MDARLPLRTPLPHQNRRLSPSFVAVIGPLADLDRLATVDYRHLIAEQRHHPKPPVTAAAAYKGIQGITSRKSQFEKLKFLRTSKL